jgi:hemerythrin
MIPARSRPLETAYRRLRRDAETLAQLLAQPLTEQSAEEVKRTLRAFRRDVAEYYRRVEPQAFVQEITYRAPHLQRQLEVWKDKHQSLMQELEKVYRQLRSQRNHLNDTKPQLQHLVDAILQHEEERDQLMYQSFYPEPAAID